MQPANILFGKETTTVTSDGDDDDGEGGGGEGVVGPESRAEYEEFKEKRVIPGQVHAVSMEVHADETDTGASTVSGEYT